MLIIRLTRRGRRNDPSFKLVVTEHSNPVKGKFLEELGFLNPKTKAKALKKERILYWISKGAKCSPTVNNLLVNESVIEGKKIKAWRPKASLAGSEKKDGGEVTKTETLKAEEKMEKPVEADAPKPESPAGEKQEAIEEKTAEGSKSAPEPEEVAVGKEEEAKS